jgi:hypothetical protein
MPVRVGLDGLASSKPTICGEFPAGVFPPMHPRLVDKVPVGPNWLSREAVFAGHHSQNVGCYWHTRFTTRWQAVDPETAEHLPLHARRRIFGGT